MNYLSEILAFNEWLIEFKLSANAQCLWYKLMAYCNSFGWKSHFTVTNSRLADDMNISRFQVDRAREELVLTGRITYALGSGNQCGTYSIIPIVCENTPSIRTQTAHKPHTVSNNSKFVCVSDALNAHKPHTNRTQTAPLNKHKLKLKQNTIEKDTNASKEKPHDDVFSDRNFSEPMKEKLSEWFSYKAERRESYKPTGQKSFLSQVENKLTLYDECDIISAIDNSMANNWKGIFYDKLTKSADKRGKINLDEYIEKPKDNSFASIVAELERKAHESN